MTVRSDLHERLRERIAADFEAEQVPWLRRLVEQPSHTYARADVEAAAAIVDEAAAAIGLGRTAIADPGGLFADHRVYATPATAEGDRAIALVGHVDTVFPRSLGFLHFRREPADDDVIHGPGVLDMKSGLSAILFALRALWAVDRPRFDALKARFVCVSDEEVGSPSSNEVVYEALAPRSSAALVFEAGREGDRIVTARKGGGAFTVTIHGRAAHAGNDHEAGVNAIHALALLIPKIEGLTDYERGVTLNVGLIEGGTAKNTVPEQARCSIDARFETAADADAVVAALHALADDPFAGVEVIPERLRTVRVEVAGRITRPPMEATPASERLRERYERCAAAVGLGVGEAPLQGGGSDANLLAARGVPCIDGLGPAGRYFHRVDEWSSLSSLRQRTLALALFLAEAE
ncbi:MAG: M20/M25/M40 family metallo-hydrolase [Myxococcales bacterium]|nr:M20/M25/M40 family metallo-hydrolase [Myxococcales bacterium]